MDKSFEKFNLDGKDKLMVSLLEDIHEELTKVNENLMKILSTQASPS